MLVPSPGWLSATAVGFGYGLRYREAAAKLLEPVQPVETLEDVWKFRFRYAWTSVPDVDEQLSVGAGGPESYPLPLRSVLHRVVHEGQYRLLHPHRVHPDETGRQERSIECRVVFCGQRPGPTFEACKQDLRLHRLHPCLLGALVLADVARGRLEADYFTAFVEYRLR